MRARAERARVPTPRIERGAFTTKGQLVVPARLRRKYKIRPGTPVSFIEQGHAIVVQPLTDAYIESVRGMLGTGGRALRALMEEKKREREL